MSTAARDTRSSESPTSLLSGVERFANTIWYCSKPKREDTLARKGSDFTTGSRQPRRLPPEIVEMIVAYLIYNTPTLKACAATCSTWYHIATPHLHHTLTFWEYFTRPECVHFNPLPFLHKLGLLPLVKRVQFKVAHYGGHWVTPAFFDSKSMRHFGALVNVQSLDIADLHFSDSSVWTGKHFGHLSLTLRSLALSYPDATRRQLLDFFRLFPRLDNLKILGYSRGDWAHEALDTQLVPIIGGLRGQLSLRSFDDAWLLKDMIVAFGGMRFTSMELQDVEEEEIPPLLEACADTLETVYMRPSNTFMSRFQRFDLSGCNTIRSLKIPTSYAYRPVRIDTIKELLSTIISPVFSEVVIAFPKSDVDRPPKELAKVLREMYEIKEFRAVFCLETTERFATQSLRRLTSQTRQAVARGSYKFLPCPPSVTYLLDDESDEE